MRPVARPYQVAMHDMCFERLAQGVWRQLAHMATGTGKTFSAGMIIESFPMKMNCAGRTLWLTHEESLIEQSAISVLCTLYPDWAKRIKEILHNEDGVLSFMLQKRLNSDLFGGKINLDYQAEQLIRANLGIIKQSLFDIQPRLVVASVQTIVNRLDRVPPDWFDVVVCDEAHLYMSPTFSKVTNYFKPKLRLGLTATPSRLDGLSLGDLFDETIIKIDLKYSIENKYLCELEAILLETNIDLGSVKKTAGEFNLSDLSDAVDTPVRNLKIVRKWQEVAEGRPTIAYCVTVEHAMNLCEQFNNCGVKATFVVADEKLCPDRKRRVNDFKKGKWDVICNVGILVAGFDHPDVGCIVSAAPTMSETKFLQSVGRGSRLKSEAFIDRFGKNNCIIIDVTDNSKRHAVVNTTTLDSGKRFEDKVFLGEERKKDLIAQRDARKLKHVQEVEETFSLLALPKPTVRMDAPWMKDAATPAQLGLIARYGYDIVGTTYTKGHCNQIISNLECTPMQTAFLIENGFDVSSGATRAQYELAQQIVLKKNTTNDFNRTIGIKNPFSGIN